MTAPSPVSPPDLAAHALAYAKAGIPVFPCVPGGKTPLTANGFHDATTDPEIVAGWWRWRPEANIATPTGTGTFDVLDVDLRPNGSGYPAYHQAKAAGLLDGWIRAVRTPSGGLHLHYPGTEQRNGSLVGLHLDFRGAGGYVLLPPSLGQCKAYSRRYELLEVRTGPGRPLDWAAVTALLQPPTPRREPVAASRRDGVDPIPWLAAHVARQPEGNRDNALFWAACRAAENNSHDFEPLIAAAVTAGLPERQAARTVQSARDTIARTTYHPTQPAQPATPAVLAR